MWGGLQLASACLKQNLSAVSVGQRFNAREKFVVYGKTAA
jgi:hypothetical protein